MPMLWCPEAASTHSWFQGLTIPFGFPISLNRATCSEHTLGWGWGISHLISWYQVGPSGLQKAGLGQGCGQGLPPSAATTTNKQKVKRTWHLEKEKGMRKQTPTLRFGPGYCNIRASASMSPSSATSDLYGSNAHAVVTGGKLLSSALPFLLLSVCPDGHPLNQLSHLIYIWGMDAYGFFRLYFVSLVGVMGIFIDTSVMNQG